MHKPTCQHRYRQRQKQVLHNIWQAANPGTEEEKAFDLFIRTYEPNIESALCLQKVREELLTFYDPGNRS